MWCGGAARRVAKHSHVCHILKLAFLDPRRRCNVSIVNVARLGTKQDVGCIGGNVCGVGCNVASVGSDVCGVCEGDGQETLGVSTSSPMVWLGPSGAGTSAAVLRAN